ncbi:caspase-8-like [Acanthochromis polyacanthus]|uniref:Caspase-8-like n=1 Tax=Acanthochromis polyacanthus TaxID=80966 RepID=A0A3Q1GQZ0_9TELE|nr:caspase-8-like [Acanthochromis polyacanthus]XP_022050950.1 caspase-8-like [Acanthochromis polyacanthus]XP_051809551.1 caspase-8-like [Acanthochromis polyacanthus]XP_051809552.1 caspase-8-like [Acanthochromis polyacanthus]
MSAKDTLRRNKTDILAALCSDRMLILNKVQEKNLITEREYGNLKNINKVNEEGHVVELVDKIMTKGEKTCQDFLDLLQTDEEIKGTFPDLSNIQLHGARPLTRPVQVSSEHSEVPLGQLSKRPKMDAVYPLNSQPVGLCLIINNVNFMSHKVRRGSDKDAQSLAEEFSKLGFRVLMCKDQTKDEMEQTLTWFSSLTDPALPLQEFRVKEWTATKFTEAQQLVNHGDAFICCVLSHGVKGAVLGTDGSPLSIKDITRTFRATEQSALKEKPKVFLIQACQGKEEQCGVLVKDLEEDSSIPEEADVLVAISTVQDYVSFRHIEDGSWFIQSVCQQLRECCPRGEDLLTILTHVNNDVSQKEGSDQPGKKKQMSEVTFNLRKTLVFSLRRN